MRVTRCEPGSIIVAGDGGPYPPDWVIGYASRVERRWLRTIVVDERGQRWFGVKVLPSGTYGLVDGHHQGVPYPAARLLRGRLDRAELPEMATVGALAGPVGARATSDRKDREAVLGVNRTRPPNPA